MNRTEIFNRITDKLICKLESGVIPWRRSWKIGAPINYVSKRHYNGINFLSLIAEDHPSPYYLMYLQAQQQGALINKGESGSLIVFWKICELPNTDNEQKNSARIPFLRYSYTFNLSQSSLYKPDNTDAGIISVEELISKMHNLPPIKNNYRTCANSLTGVFLQHGTPRYIRSDNGPEFVAELIRGWLKDLGVSTAFIEPGSPWENGYIELFNGKFRDELLNGEIFDTIYEAQVLTEKWRRYYNTLRPHSALSYRPPAPETFIPYQVAIA